MPGKTGRKRLIHLRSQAEEYAVDHSSLISSFTGAVSNGSNLLRKIVYLEKYDILRRNMARLVPALLSFKIFQPRFPDRIFRCGTSKYFFQLNTRPPDLVKSPRFLPIFHKGCSAPLHGLKPSRGGVMLILS
jgi:hypothetical protein